MAGLLYADVCSWVGSCGVSLESMRSVATLSSCCSSLICLQAMRHSSLALVKVVACGSAGKQSSSACQTAVRAACQRRTVTDHCWSCQYPVHALCGYH